MKHYFSRDPLMLVPVGKFYTNTLINQGARLEQSFIETICLILQQIKLRIWESLIFFTIPGNEKSIIHLKKDHFFGKTFYLKDGKG